MILAIDYDNTYTRDPPLWNTFIKLARKRGHIVFCVTARHEDDGEDVIEDLHNRVDWIFFTDGDYKQEWLREYRNIIVDIWIDNAPLTV